jgi:hypothetical protein
MRPDDRAGRRARILAALEGLPDGPAARRVRAVLAGLRRRPDTVIALLLGVGVLAMILHWR